MLTRTCLCLIRRTTPAGPEVLLGLKKTGFGQGRWVNLGGHIEPGEKAAAAAVREVEEESGLVVSADVLQHVASIEFRFPWRPSWDQTAEVYLTATFAGEAAESDEIAPRWEAIQRDREAMQAVLAEILRVYPAADLHALVDFLPDADRSRLGGKRATTTFLQRLPFARTSFRVWLPLFPRAIESLDVARYDLVISSSHAVAKGVRTLGAEAPLQKV